VISTLPECLFINPTVLKPNRYTTIFEHGPYEVIDGT